MGYFGWKPYVPVAERRKKAEKTAAKIQKKGVALTPVIGGRGSIAKTFWGKAWCENLERYSDYANRLPRGRAYVRNGSVIDLKISEGAIQAQVMGSRLYQVEVSVSCSARAPVAGHQRRLCRIDSYTGRVVAGEIIQGGDGAHLHAENGSVPRSERNQFYLQLPRLGCDVQARCCGAVWHRCAAG